MKIATLADIHGNAEAFDRVADAIHSEGIDTLFVLGDLVGYYYWPSQVLKTLSLFKRVELIIGNPERMLRDSIRSPEALAKITTKYGHGIQTAIDTLSDSEKNTLLNQPESLSVSIDGLFCVLAHGSPSDPDQYLYPDTPRSVMESCIQYSPIPDFVFVGHSHYPFCHHSGQTTVVNPGSVGQPRDIGNMASYAILDTTNKTIQFKRIPFDTRRIQTEVAIRDPNLPYLASIFLRNISNV